MNAWLGQFAGRPAPSDAAPRALPAQLRTAQAAQAWSEHEPGQGRGYHLATAALFLAACVWRRAGITPVLALPFWSATPGQLDHLALTAGPAWIFGFLMVVADAARGANQELSWLQGAAKAAALRRTARSSPPPRCSPSAVRC